MKTYYKGHVNPKIGKEVTIFDNAYNKYTVYQDGKVVNTKTGRELKQHKDTSNYMYVSLTAPGIKGVKKIRVHTLVFRTFVHNDYDPKKFVVDHRSCDKNNNLLNNLRLLTYSQNTKAYHDNKQTCSDFRQKNQQKQQRANTKRDKRDHEEIEEFYSLIIGDDCVEQF